MSTKEVRASAREAVRDFGRAWWYAIGLVVVSPMYWVLSLGATGLLIAIAIQQSGDPS